MWSLSSMAVESLLRTAWIVAMLPFLVASIPFSKINPFRRFTLDISGRGKIMEYSSSKKWSVSQKYFRHFYIVGVIWNTILLVATWVYAYKKEYEYCGIWKCVFLLMLMEAHLLRRLIESIYVFNYSPTAQMNISVYLIGLLYYIASPLSLCCTYCMEVFSNLMAYSIGKGKKDDGLILQKESELLNIPVLQVEWYAWIGAAVFFWGWMHQRRCHAILGSIRKNGDKVDKYEIPEGDWFRYVSSPHYLAEIVMYGGLVIASGFSNITICLLFAFVVVNLTFAADETHRWYLRKFDNYPTNRYAIIPCIY